MVRIRAFIQSLPRAPSLFGRHVEEEDGDDASPGALEQETVMEEEHKQV